MFPFPKNPAQLLEQAILQVDKGLRTVFAPAHTERPSPAVNIAEAPMSEAERAHVIGLMRINHCGEVCAQALYQGQALTARNEEAKRALEHAAFEETEHLAWTAERLQQLGGRPSIFNPLWYVGSLAIGVGAGILGDRWNLGFLEETEYQVEAHLSEHLESLPPQDAKSAAILQQMKIDEVRHAEMAHAYGAAPLPAPVKAVMSFTSKMMKAASYKI